MIAEPQRSQYLEAMGLTVWVSRYRLPNAAETPACEWSEPEIAPEHPPAQRLHALLDTPSAPVPPADPVAPVATPVRHQKRARGLLESEGMVETVPPMTTETAAQLPEAPRTTHEPLRFTLQVAALDGRWLVVLPDGQAPDDTSRKLLDNLLQAASIVPRSAPTFQAFSWPLVEGLPVEAPHDEACEGLRAFIDGQHRRGWRPERVLVFGEDATLADVLAIEEERCDLLGLAGWQGPRLMRLAESAAAKRELWRTLVAWREAWHRAADEEYAVNSRADDRDAAT